MKHTITLATMILIIFSHGACRTSKLSARSKARHIVGERSDFKNRVMDINRYDKFKTITDSSHQSYQLTIFPADTFKFSIQNGFIGKATKIIITGSGSQLKHILDTSKYVQTSTTDTEVTMTRNEQTNIRGRSAVVERGYLMWKWICAATVVGLVLFIGWRRFRKFLPQLK
ncbi:hypothetical protein [Daejeonella sp.]|uniref:hypothetical protein n=1 Tax=Daejeonella sp. TaxID=2805397 RepID=UPI0030C058AE